MDRRCWCCGGTFTKPGEESRAFGFVLARDLLPILDGTAPTGHVVRETCWRCAERGMVHPWWRRWWWRVFEKA